MVSTARSLCFDLNFSHLPHCREDKIARLCSVMGVQPVHDPDNAHEQTTDNGGMGYDQRVHDPDSAHGLTTDNGSMGDDQRVHDPDSAYELTTDNFKKILAIHMRFRYALVIIKPSDKPCDGLLTVEKMLNFKPPLSLLFFF